MLKQREVKTRPVVSHWKQDFNTAHAHDTGIVRECPQQWTDRLDIF